MLLFYVRHGDPIYNPDSLTELGKAQAEALVERMKECNPDKIYASSSNRAIMTAQPTAKFLNKEIEILDWCNESHAWNEFTIKNSEGNKEWCFQNEHIIKKFCSDEIRKMDKKWYDHPDFSDYEFKSGTFRVQSEVDQFMLNLGYAHDHEKNGYIPVKANDSRAALFAHGGFGMIFLSCLLDIPYPQVCTHFDLQTSGVTVIKFAGEDFVIPKVLQLSNDSHIFAAGIPTNYHNDIHF